MNEPLPPEDIQEALIANRPIREQGPYRVLIGDESLTYRPVVIEDPVPTGRQILEAAGARPVLEFSVFQVLKDGQIESLRFDEIVDLRARGAEKFLMFGSDRAFRFDIDGSVFEWGLHRISGAVLKTLAKVDLVTYGVWQEVRGGEDRQIGDAEYADLSSEGVERFFTGIVKTTEG